MKRYAVIGASSGTGLEIVRLLASRGQHVRAISRSPRASSTPNELIEQVAADVTDATSISKALDGQFDAVFFTVDIHQKGASEELVRDVMYQGCVNSIRAASALSPAPKFVLLSVMGAHKSSWVWWLLNMLKKGMKRNVVDRERALIDSGLPFSILRAPRLTDKFDETKIALLQLAERRMDMMSSISRRGLAKAMIDASNLSESSVWDVIEK